MVSPRNYVICSTQRSGSTFFCEALKKSSSFGIPKEWLVFLEIPDDKLSEKERELKRLPVLQITTARADIQKKFRQGVLGWKIMWSTIAELERRLKRENKSLDKSFLDIAFENPKFIYYQRLNKIAQAISHAILVKTNISHLQNSVNSSEAWDKKKENLHISEEQIIFFLKKILMEEREWEKFFESNNIQPMRIFYEDFCGDILHNIINVGKFLDIEIGIEKVEQVPKKISLKKTRSKFESDLAEKFLWHLCAINN